ncbi:MAG TPA: CHAT domain-containing protein, partial [Candidatus Polarisedimenticolaceae bacterium]|nr:CHAT domain-containing protein [Candidatus Polarisedimenticolaceae bacterium]
YGRARQQDDAGWRRGLALVRYETGPISEARSLAAEARAPLEARLERQRGAWDLAGAAESFEWLGDMACVLESWSEASDRYTQAAALYRAVGDAAGEGRAQLGLGSAREGADDAEGAIAAYEAGLSLARAAGDTATEAELGTRLGSAQFSLGRYDDARAANEQALATARAARLRWSEALALRGLGAVRIGKGEFEPALEPLRASAAAFLELGARTREHNSRLLLAVALRNLSRYGEMQAELERDRALAAALGDPAVDSQAFNLRASYEERVGKYDDAIADGERALELARTAGSASDESAALANLSTAYADVGRYDRSSTCQERSLELRRAAGNRDGEATVLNNLGTLYLRLSRYDRAIESFERAQAIRRAQGDANGEAEILTNLGVAFDDLAMYDEALASHEAALVLLRRSGARHQQSAALNNLVSVYFHLGRLDDAERTNGESLAIAREIGDRSGQAVALGNQAFLAGERGRTREQIAAYEQSLAIDREIGERPTEALHLNNLMLAWKQAGNPLLAIFYGKQAVNVYQELRGHTRELEQASQRSFLESAEDTYRELADLLIAAGRLPEAQQVLQMLKQEEFFGFVRRDASTADALAVRVELNPSEREIEARYAETAGQLGKLGAERGTLLAKSERDAAEEARLTRIEADLEAASTRFQSFLDELPQRLGETQEAGKRLGELRSATALMSDLAELGPGAVALYTVAAEDRVWVVLTTPDFERAYETPIARSELNRKVFAFQQVLRHPGLDPRPAARELYAILVAPLAADLEAAGATTLMWSLDGALRYVPVGALHDGERYLVERYRSVVFTPASQARLKDVPRHDWKVLGLGVSKAWGDFPALEGVPRELAGIVQPAADAAGIFPGEVKLDGEFTKDAMKAALRGGFPVVHIASHFAFRPGNETDSYLLLGDGSHFDLGEIRAAAGRQLFRGVDLLTLSACDTASGGGGGDGREVEGFAVIAQDQGAKAVVASLWPVSDESTTLLMQEFYRRRAAHPDEPKIEALRGAQLALLRGELAASAGGAEHRGVSLGEDPAPESAPAFTPDPRAPFAHPYFWAPFILIGNWK